MIASPVNLRVAFIPISPRSNFKPEFSASGAPGMLLPGIALFRKTLGL